MSQMYMLMIYFGVSMLHYYRDSIEPFEGTTLGDFAAVNQRVLMQVALEARNQFSYELSHAQIGKIVELYLGRGAKL